MLPIYFIVGNYRYYCYFVNPKFQFLLRNTVRNSIKEVLGQINKKCYNGVSCKNCGCHVPKQNLGGKPCDCSWVSIKGRIESKEIKYIYHYKPKGDE